VLARCSSCNSSDGYSLRLPLLVSHDQLWKYLGHFLRNQSILARLLTRRIGLLVAELDRTELLEPLAGIGLEGLLGQLDRVYSIFRGSSSRLSTASRAKGELKQSACYFLR
jgi:hypothetical protein